METYVTEMSEGQESVNDFLAMFYDDEAEDCGDEDRSVALHSIDFG